MRNKYNRLRLILADQLNHEHSWLKQIDNHTLYLFIEIKDSISKQVQHVQKICARYAAMEAFANELSALGHQVIYLNLDDSEQYQSLEQLLEHLSNNNNIEFFDYQQPDNFATAQQLKRLNLGHNVTISCYESEHFYLEHSLINTHFKAGNATRMELFYRKMRKQFSILMTNNEPEGGQWNFEANLTRKMKPEQVRSIPEPLCFSNPVSQILNRLDRHQIITIGKREKVLLWPVTRGQAIELLAYFCSYMLPTFGQNYDAMNTSSPFQWSMLHSRLSFALNSKLISPKLVIKFALSTYRENPNLISLSQIERFVRQILGWREFVRGVYWVNMPQYQDSNALAATTPLPPFYRNGNTKMNCLRHCISQTIEFAYAHHIQRLMILGNFCLIAGIEPSQVERWFYQMFIDSAQWIQLPNSLGMSQFADGGLVASKPYAASANYIHKTSDYCDNCHYKYQKKHGELACPFNSLYWAFLLKHRQPFQRNSRLAMLYQNWDKLLKSEQESIRAQATKYAQTLNEL